jgi:site-specific DNA-methyltransferase (cytosine-N4-specific)
MDNLYVGDCREGMRLFLSNGMRVATCVTSPPYWGLRDYGCAGQLGLEPTIAEYVTNMVEVFRLVHELLADDGTLWLNLGDSYTSGGRDSYGTWAPDSKQATHTAIKSSPRAAQPEGLKPKDLCGIPWRVAFALQADGWYLRSDVIWAKPNPMPESVTDRPTKAHEYLFLMAKRERYYYDATAIVEEAKYGYSPTPMMFAGVGDARTAPQRKTGSVEVGDGGTRNRRSVWTIATEPFPDAHFATFPTALVEPCILAGSRVGDTVFDPFMGSGTVAQVAQDLGRNWLGCELSPEYARMIRKRTRQQAFTLEAAD